VDDFHDVKNWTKYLGNKNEKYYPDWLDFFEEEIDTKGYQNVINGYLFAGDEYADNMLTRLYGGFLHPIIHLGFGIEFEQPAIIAEALAQTAVHDDWIGRLLIPAEKASREGEARPEKTLMQLMTEARAVDKLAQSAHWDDGNKIRDGILARAPEEMIKIAAQYAVRPEQLEEKAAEHVNFTGASPPDPQFHEF
jgi:hypothetical protein